MNHLAKTGEPPRLSIVGIGNELNGDDAAGVLILRILKRRLPVDKRIQLLEGSIAPENYASTISRFSPDWLWLVDAADFRENPGSLKLIDLDRIEIGVPSTHSLSPDLLFSIFNLNTQVKIFFFGIQPESVESFTEPSGVIHKTIRNTANFLLHWTKFAYNI